jgi:hypothetical protein
MNESNVWGEKLSWFKYSSKCGSFLNTFHIFLLLPSDKIVDASLFASKVRGRAPCVWFSNPVWLFFFPNVIIDPNCHLHSIKSEWYFTDSLAIDFSESGLARRYSFVYGLPNNQTVRRPLRRLEHGSLLRWEVISVPPDPWAGTQPTADYLQMFIQRTFTPIFHAEMDSSIHILKRNRLK